MNKVPSMRDQIMLTSCKATITSDDEDDNNFIQDVAFPRKNRPSSFGRNHRSILDSSESEDDYVLSKNRPSSFGRNHRSILDSSESEDDQGHYVLSKNTRQTNDISSLLRMLLINQRGGGGAGRSQLTINRNRRTIPDYSDSCTDDEGMTQHNYNGKIKHFSHPHNLNNYNLQQYSGINCKVCSLQLVGSAYGCQSCQFYVHASCFDLPQKIQHDAHPAHPLTLRYPSYYKHCTKVCDACGENIRQSFLYCCDPCDFDLHVTCATLYGIVRMSQGTLRLYYKFPFGDSNNNIIPRCNVCNKQVSKQGWLYYNKDTGHIAHVNCAKGNIAPSWIKEKLNMLKIK